MSTFRDQKRAARQQLHSVMAEPVLLVPNVDAEPVNSTARIHLEFLDQGDLRRAGFAEMADLTPRAIFLNSSSTPTRGWLIVTRDMGAFQVEVVDPANDITTVVRISRLPESKYVAYGMTKGQTWCGLPSPTV